MIEVLNQCNIIKSEIFVHEIMVRGNVVVCDQVTCTFLVLIFMLLLNLIPIQFPDCNKMQYSSSYVYTHYYASSITHYYVPDIMYKSCTGLPTC